MPNQLMCVLVLDRIHMAPRSGKIPYLLLSYRDLMEAQAAFKQRVKSAMQTVLKPWYNGVKPIPPASHKISAYSFEFLRDVGLGGANDYEVWMLPLTVPSPSPKGGASTPACSGGPAGPQGPQGPTTVPSSAPAGSSKTISVPNAAQAPSAPPFTARVGNGLTKVVLPDGTSFDIDGNTLADALKSALQGPVGNSASNAGGGVAFSDAEPDDEEEDSLG